MNPLPKPPPFLCAFLTILLSTAVAAAPVAAQDVLVIRADDQFAYAEELFENGEWQSAVTEYRRFVHFFAGDDRVPLAWLQTARANQALGRPKEALKAVEEVIDAAGAADPAGSPSLLDAYVLKSDLYRQEGAFGLAARTLENAVALTGDPETTDRLRYGLGWVWIEAGDLDRARAALDAMQGDPPRARRLREALDGAGAVDQKNPTVAGLLSVIPGLGQAYCGRYRDALVALVVNGLFIAGTVEAFDNDLEALGVGLGLLGAGFYAGNIYSAVNSAQKYNRNRQREWFRGLEDRHRIGNAGGGPGVGLSLQFSF